MRGELWAWEIWECVEERMGGEETVCVGSSFQKLAVNDCKEMRWLEGSVGTTGRMFASGGLCANRNSPVESGTDVAGETVGTKSLGR